MYPNHWYELGYFSQMKYDMNMTNVDRGAIGAFKENMSGLGDDVRTTVSSLRFEMLGFHECFPRVEK